MATSQSNRLSTKPKPVKRARPVLKEPLVADLTAAPKQAETKVEASPKVKSKLVRDSFTIPKTEYQVLELLKLRAINLKRPAKKGELLRAGIALLHTLSEPAFLAALNAIPSLQTGRPKSTK